MYCISLSHNDKTFHSFVKWRDGIDIIVNASKDLCRHIRCGTSLWYSVGIFCWHVLRCQVPIRLQRLTVFVTCLPMLACIKAAIWHQRRACYEHGSLSNLIMLHVTCAGLSVMMTSSNGYIFRVTGPLCGEFTGHRWIPRYAELWCFLSSASE